MLAVYAVYRVFASVVNVLRGRAGDADPVTVACGILVHVFADWDVRLWAKEISFLFVGSLIVSSGRSFFQEVSNRHRDRDASIIKPTPAINIHFF